MLILLEETSYSPRHLWPVHFWHTVVQEYDLVHRCFAFNGFFETTFDELEGKSTARNSIYTISLSFKHQAHHLYVELLIVHDKNDW